MRLGDLDALKKAITTTLEKEGVLTRTGLFKIIDNAQTVEERPQGDLISREALKEAFDCVGFNDYDDYNRALRIIDNAPTVEPEVYMTAKDYNLYLEGYKQGRKDFGRPQG